MSHQGPQASISNSPPGASSKIPFQYWKDLVHLLVKAEHASEDLPPAQTMQLYIFLRWPYWVAVHTSEKSGLEMSPEDFMHQGDCC